MAQPEEELWQMVEKFYRREASLLQHGDYDRWLEMMTTDIRYRAPVVRVLDDRTEVVAPDGALAYYDEDRESLELRVRKFASTMAWTEYPPSRLRYFVQLMDVHDGREAVCATSNFLVFQVRHESRENVFYGERVDTLRRMGEALLIARRHVVLDRARLPSENISLFF
jgi:3-phenylpropionate/cinnamic acid dioxygenase small subunit